jgi:hypothetical protein
MAIAAPLRRGGTELGLQAASLTLPARAGSSLLRCAPRTSSREEWPRMLNFQAIRLMHNHGNGEYIDMVERDHDAADHDPERAWLRGARIFKCRTCSEEVVVVPPGQEPGDTLSKSA